MKLEYCKAVPLSDCKSIVYACQFREEDFSFEENPLGKFFFLSMNNEIFPVTPNQWLVWFPMTIEFTFMDDEEFREKFIQYEELPPKIKSLADKHLSFVEWVENCNGLRAS